MAESSKDVVLRRIQTELSPRTDAPESAVREALTQLLGDGLIELYAGEVGADNDPQILDLDKARTALAVGPQWRVPDEPSAGPFVYFAATDAGLALVRATHWGEHH